MWIDQVDGRGMIDGVVPLVGRIVALVIHAEVPGQRQQRSVRAGDADVGRQKLRAQDGAGLVAEFAGLAQRTVRGEVGVAADASIVPRIVITLLGALVALLVMVTPLPFASVSVSAVPSALGLFASGVATVWKMFCSSFVVEPSTSVVR